MPSQEPVLRALNSLKPQAKSIGDLAKLFRAQPSETSRLFGRSNDLLDAVRQERRQRAPPHGGRALEAHAVATAQHDPGVERQGSSDGVGQLLARRLAQGS